MKKLWMMALAACAVAGCAKEPEGAPVSGSHLAVRIDPTIVRATEVDFEEGDAVGLTIVLDGGTNHVTNDEMVMTDGVFVSKNGLSWYEDLGAESTLRAYYPYAASEPTSFAVEADQTAEGYNLSDLMMASKTAVRPSVQAVDMTFRHKMTKIVVEITNEQGLTVEGVKILNAVGTADVDVAAQTVTAASEAAEVTVAAHQLAENRYAAILVPQTAQLSVELTVNDGKEQKLLKHSLKEATLASGAQYTMSVTVLPWNLDANLSGDIENWGDGGELEVEGSEEGDVKPDFEEFDTYFVYDGEHYNIVTLKDGNTWMAETLRYVPKGKKPSGDPTDKSGVWYPAANAAPAAGDASLISTRGLLYNAATAFGVKEITDENASTLEGTQGICPDGWHIPTVTEMVNLVGKCSNSSLDNLSAPYYEATQTGGSIDALDTDGFNWVCAGIVNIASPTGSPMYSATPTPAGVDPVIYGAMSYVWGSTFYQKNSSTGNMQFYSFMSTWNANFKRVTVAYGNFLSGYSVRCVKDK